MATVDAPPARSWSRSNRVALWLAAGSIAGPALLAWIPFLLPDPFAPIAWPLFAATIALAALAGAGALVLGARAWTAAEADHRSWIAALLGLVGLGLSISIGFGMLWGLSNLSNLSNLRNL